MTLTARLQTRRAHTSLLARARGPESDELRRELLAGSRIAVIEPGYPNKRFVYERAAALGVELVLVAKPGSWAHTLVGEGVAARLLGADPSGEPDRAAAAVLAALAEEADSLDGVVTFWEDAVPATARIAAALGVPGIPLPPLTARAASCARSRRAAPPACPPPASRSSTTRRACGPPRRRWASRP